MGVKFDENERKKDFLDGLFDWKNKKKGKNLFENSQGEEKLIEGEGKDRIRKFTYIHTYFDRIYLLPWVNMYKFIYIYIHGHVFY